MPLSHEDFWTRAQPVLAETGVSGAAELQAKISRLLGSEDWRENSGAKLYDTLSTQVPAARLDGFGSVDDNPTKVTWLTELTDDLARPLNTPDGSGSYYWAGMVQGWREVPEEFYLSNGVWELSSDLVEHDAEESRERITSEPLSLAAAISENQLDDWLTAGYVFFYKGVALVGTNDWVKFYDAGGQPMTAPPSGTYQTWSRDGAGTGTYPKPQPSAPGSGSASSSSSSSSSTSGVLLAEAVQQAGLQAQAQAGCEFFYDGGALKYTEDWVTFYDAHRAVTSAPPQGTMTTWSQTGGYGNATYALDPADTDDDDILASAFGAGSHSAKEKAQKEKDGKTKEAPKIALDSDGYVFVDNQVVTVNGCWMFEDHNGALYAEAGSGTTFTVMKGSAPLTSKAGLTFEHGHAKVGADPLSLDDQWQFAWGVIIADTEKYEQAAFNSFRDTLTALSITGDRPGQVYATVGDVNGYPLHISINASDMREEIRKLIGRGKTPAVGFLVNVRFHVTVEVDGQSSPDNPHVWSNSGGGWTGPINRLGGVSAQTAIKQGRDWLSTNR